MTDETDPATSKERPFQRRVLDWMFEGQRFKPVFESVET